jgi:EmrB/QacA subfamily drug resistance transporter
VLGVLCLSLTLVMVSNGSLNVALPSIARELDATSSDLQWIVDAYALVFAGMLFAAATLGDRFGRKGALQVGLLLFVLAAIGGMLSDSSSQVIAARAVMGLGAAFVMPSTLSILTNVFPERERGKAISLWAGVAAGGAALGPPTSGLLLEHFWWGSVFLITVPIAVVALAVGHFLVPKTRDPAGTRVDVAGVAMSIVGIGALVYAIIEAPHRGWLSAATIGWFALAALSIVAFVWWERRCSHPMLDLKLFLDRRFSIASIGIAMAFFAMFGTFFLSTQLFQLVHGLSPLEAGLLILPMSFTLMLVSPRAAGLAERYGVATLAPIGLTIMAVGLLALAWFARLDSFWWAVLALVPMATGMALTMTPLTTLIMSTVPASRAGMGSAMNDATRELGGALGVAVLGSVTTTVYVGQLPALGAFSPGARHETEAGLAGALSRASELGGGAADAFVDAARAAFVDGLSVSIIVAAALAATAAVVARRFLPRPALPPGSEYEVATTPGTAAAASVNPRSAGGAGQATPAGTPAG